MSQDPYYDEDEARIRREIEKRYKKQRGLWVHFAVYAMVNLMLWAIWSFVTPTMGIMVGVAGKIISESIIPAFPWPMIITVSWGIGLALHFLSYYYKYGGGAQRREEAIQQEIERYRDQYGYEKPKNRSHMELTEDGEIEEVYEDFEVRKRRRE